MGKLLQRLKSDEALMQAYQRGDAAAFEQLYRRHKDGLFAFLYRSCPRPAVVEELAQDSWTAVINSAARYRPEAKFRTWLYQIAHNRVADYWRRRDNRHAPLEEVAEPLAAELPSLTSEQILAAVGRLARDQQDALLLQEQGFTVGDIATITDVGEETVKSRLRYARKHLRSLLEGEL